MASSTTHGEPVAEQFRRIFLPYWTKRPPPFTLYKRPYERMWKKGFYSPEKSLKFRVSAHERRLWVDPAGLPV